VAAISYAKNNKNFMYFLEIDGMKIPKQICEYLNMSFEEYIHTIQLCGGKYSSKYGWYLSNEENAMKCCVLLSLLKK